MHAMHPRPDSKQYSITYFVLEVPPSLTSHVLEQCATSLRLFQASCVTARFSLLSALLQDCSHEVEESYPPTTNISEVTRVSGYVLAVP
jgi:hypothetical protein